MDQLSAINDNIEHLEWSIDKFLKLADNILHELKTTWTYKDTWDDHITTICEKLHDDSILSDDERNTIYSWELEKHEIVFLLLEKLVLNSYFIEYEIWFDDLSSNALDHKIAWNIYTRLGKQLNKTIADFPFSKYEKTKPLTNHQKKDLELEQETLEVLSILIRWSFLENSDDHIRLYAYIQFLYSKELLTESEFINASCTNDIEEALKIIILKKLIAPGKITTIHIVNAFHQFSHAFTESRREEGKNRVDKILTDNEGSWDEFNQHEIPKEVSDRLFQSIIQAFEFDISEIYDRETLLLLLKRTWLIWDKEEWYFRTINSHTDFARYLKVVLSKYGAFMDSLTNKQLKELERCFYALDMYCWEIVEQQILETNESRSMIIDLGNSIINDLLSNSSKRLTHNFLDWTLELIQEYFPYKPFYMRLLHIDFDELYELSSEHHKALQIIWILVFDILNASDSCFEGMYQYLQSNLRNWKTKVGLERIYTQKCQVFEQS